MYVLDSSALIDLHKYYFPARFPTLWKRFDAMIAKNLFTSTREAFEELTVSDDRAAQWAKEHEDLFVLPDADEARFVTKIFSVPHFRANVSQQKILQGGWFADPFLVARAAVLRGAVVTREKYRPKAAKLPNICEHFKVPCFDLEAFMEKENWTF